MLQRDATVRHKTFSADVSSSPSAVIGVGIDTSRYRGDGRGRTFSVNLSKNLFQCFDTHCAAKGDVIDLWAKLHGRSVREAALELVQTFQLEPAPRPYSPHRPGHG
jgi:hypothetical protein